ncbi:hypothetical protein GCM10010520_06790 [Rhizobium viscosum]
MQANGSYYEFGYDTDDTQRFADDLGADIRTNSLYERVTTIDVRRAPIAVDGQGQVAKMPKRYPARLKNQGIKGF